MKAQYAKRVVVEGKPSNTVITDYAAFAMILTGKLLVRSLPGVRGVRCSLVTGQAWDYEF